MAGVTRWLAFAAILTALPIAGWRIAELAGKEALEPEGVDRQASTRETRTSLVARDGEVFEATVVAQKGPEAAGIEPRLMRKQLGAEPIIVANMTESDLRVLKENYSCDLALSARQECDEAYDDPAAYDMCLSLRQYYSYSRHCGYEP